MVATKSKPKRKKKFSLSDEPQFMMYLRGAREPKGGTTRAYCVLFFRSKDEIQVEGGLYPTRAEAEKFRKQILKEIGKPSKETRRRCVVCPVDFQVELVTNRKDGDELLPPAIEYFGCLMVDEIELNEVES